MSAKPPDKGGTEETMVRKRKGAPEKQEENQTTETIEEQQVDNQNAEAATVQQQEQQAQPQQVPTEVIYLPPNRIILAVPKCLCYGVGAFFALLFIIAGGVVGDIVWRTYMLPTPDPDFDPYPAITAAIGAEGVNFFKQHDRDNDGYLSLEEFEAVFHTLNGTGFNVSIPAAGLQFTQSIDDDDEIVTVRAYFQPLILETMTKDLNETNEGGFFSDKGVQGGVHLNGPVAMPPPSMFKKWFRQSRHLDTLTGLKTWKALNMEWMNFGIRHFKGFLPPDESYLQDLGSVYDIYESDGVSMFGQSRHSSNRYYPPKVKEDLLGIHRLLTLFHPRPFLQTRFAPQGAVACIRAVNDQYIDIVYRIHAEFQLNEPPYYPFWYTPSQFRGNLVISRDYKRIINFNMYVPNDRLLNVDMEWMNAPSDEENMEVDIGKMPQMELNITASSLPLKKEELHLKDYEIDEDTNLIEKTKTIKWKSEISLQDAWRSLEVKMYPFKKVTYYNFTDAFDKAQEEKKLVHSILLWGALDDQSC